MEIPHASDGRDPRQDRRCAGLSHYLSYDIDSLDPAFAPGTGTVEVGGLMTWQALEIVRGCAGLNLVGGDLVDVSPPYCPHLNPIERLWAMMHQFVTHNRNYPTQKQFAGAILKFFCETIPNE